MPTPRIWCSRVSPSASAAAGVVPDELGEVVEAPSEREREPLLPDGSSPAAARRLVVGKVVGRADVALAEIPASPDAHATTAARAIPPPPPALGPPRSGRSEVRHRGEHLLHRLRRADLPISCARRRSARPALRQESGPLLAAAALAAASSRAQRASSSAGRSLAMRLRQPLGVEQRAPASCMPISCAALRARAPNPNPRRPPTASAVGRRE